MAKTAMADIDITKIQAQIQSFKLANPQAVKGLNDEQVVSIMVQQGAMTKETATQLSQILSGEFIKSEGSVLGQKSHTITGKDKNGNLKSDIYIDFNGDNVADLKIFRQGNNVSVFASQQTNGKITGWTTTNNYDEYKFAILDSQEKFDALDLKRVPANKNQGEKVVTQEYWDSKGQIYKAKKVIPGDSKRAILFEGATPESQQAVLNGEINLKDVDKYLQENQLDKNNPENKARLEYIEGCTDEEFKNFLKLSPEEQKNIDFRLRKTQEVTLAVWRDRISKFETAAECQTNIYALIEGCEKEGSLDNVALVLKAMEEKLQTFPKKVVDRVKTPEWKAQMITSQKLNDMVFDTLKAKHEEATQVFENTKNQMGWCDDLGQAFKDIFGETDVEEAQRRLSENNEKIQKLEKKRKYLTSRQFGMEVENCMGGDYDYKLVEKIANNHPEYLQLTSAKQTVDVLTEMSKQEYSKENFQNIQTALGGEDYLSQIFPEYSKLSLEEKFKKLQLLSSEAAKTAQTQLKELLGDRDYETITKEHEKDYKEFLYMIGANDITEAMEEFQSDVAFAGGVARIGVTIAATVALTVATGGTGAVALGAISAGTSAAIDVSNRATNGIDDSQDLFNGESIRDIAVDAAVAGVSAGGGGKAADLVWKTGMSKAGKFLTTTAADSAIGIVVTGAGMELKGQNFTDMTAGEVVQNITFAAAGSAINVATSRVRYTSLTGDVNFTTNKAYAVGAWLRKSGILKDEIPRNKLYDDSFDINKEYQINGGKELSPSQMEILNKVANSKARFTTTKQLDDLINMKNMADVDARIHAFSTFKPEKGKPPIIEENGTVQLNTSNPVEIRKYLKTIGIEAERYQHLETFKIPSKGEKIIPLTNLQVETLNKVINNALMPYKSKPSLDQIEKLLQLDDKAVINTIIENNNFYIIDLNPQQIELFMQMHAAKNADGTPVYDRYLNNFDVELCEKIGQDAFSNFYKFRDNYKYRIFDNYEINRYINTPEDCNISLETLISRTKECAEFFTKNKHFKIDSTSDIKFFIEDLSDEEFKRMLETLENINKSIPENVDKNKYLDDIFGFPLLDNVFEREFTRNSTKELSEIFNIAKETNTSVNLEMFKQNKGQINITGEIIHAYKQGEVDKVKFMLMTNKKCSNYYYDEIAEAWKKSKQTIDDANFFSELLEMPYSTIKTIIANKDANNIFKRINKLFKNKDSYINTTDFYREIAGGNFSETEITTINKILDIVEKNPEKAKEIKIYSVLEKLKNADFLKDELFNCKYSPLEITEALSIDTWSTNFPLSKLLNTEIKGFDLLSSVKNLGGYLTDAHIDKLALIGEKSPALVQKISQHPQYLNSIDFALVALERKIPQAIIEKGIDFECKAADIETIQYINQKAPHLLEISSKLGYDSNKPLILSLMKDYIDSGILNKYPQNVVEMGLLGEIPSSHITMVKEIMTLIPDIHPLFAKKIFNLSFDATITKNKSIIEIQNIAHSMKSNYENLLKMYPQLENCSIMKNIEDAGGINAAIARLYESKMNTIKPIKPRLGTKSASRVQGDMFVALKSQNLEKAFKNFDFEKYATGIPLSYPRTKFVEDINEILKNCSNADKKVIAEQFGFEFTPQGHIDQFPRPVDSFAKNLTPEQRAICEKLNPIINKFIYENKVVLPEHPQMQTLLNSIIDMFPEFISVIGKQQHGTHAYSVDMHTLKVLQGCIEHPNYKNLETKDKTILHLATLMHDLGKMEAVVDDGHYLQSALYTRNMLEKLNLNREMQERVFNLVENHHWRGELMTGKIDEQTVAARFRSPKDWELAQIFADADLKGVSESFYNEKIALMKWDKIKKVEEAITQIHKTGIPIFSSKMLNHPKFPHTTEEGVPYINIAHATDEQIKKVFGSYATKDNLILHVHMCRDSAENYNTLRILSALGNEGHLSSTLISGKNTRTYGHQHRGILLETNPSNVTEAFYRNTGSGNAKDGDAMVRMLNSEGDTKLYASNFIKDKLDLTPAEYSELYKYIADRKFQHINDIEINGKKISGDAIRHAITEFQDDLIMRSPNIHNEVCVYNPEMKALIALADSIDEVSQEMKDFAKQHNFPIIIHPNIEVKNYN